MIASAAELLAAAGLRTAEITVCGVTLRIREMSVAAWRRVAAGRSDNRSAACQMVADCVIGADGAPLFAGNEQGTEELRPEMLDAISAEILKLSGIKDDPGKG